MTEDICNNCDQGPCGTQKIIILPDPMPEHDAFMAEDPIEKGMAGKVFKVAQQITQGGRKYSYISNPEFYDNNPITVVPSDWLKDVECIPASEIGVTNQALLDVQGLKNRVEELQSSLEQWKETANKVNSKQADGQLRIKDLESAMQKFIGDWRRSYSLGEGAKKVRYRVGSNACKTFEQLLKK